MAMIQVVSSPGYDLVFPMRTKICTLRANNERIVFIISLNLYPCPALAFYWLLLQRKSRVFYRAHEIKNHGY